MAGSAEMAGRGQKGIGEFAPATFQERGVAVPFTTPMLSQARVRRDVDKRLEILLANFTAGAGVYVLPWKAVPGMATLTLHDRLLFEQVEGLSAHTPEQIRAASLTVAATGVCGAEAAAAAQAQVEEDEQYRVLSQFVLMTALLRLVGIGAADLIRPGMSGEESKRVARHAIAKVATLLEVPADLLTERVDRLGLLMAPAGLPMAPKPGRLRRLAARLGQFADAAEAWSAAEPSDAAPLGAHAAALARHTLSLVTDCTGALDGLWADVRALVMRAEAGAAAVEAQVTRLSWLLDGWDFLLALWEQAAEADAAGRIAAMMELARLLPVVPRAEGVVMEAALLDKDGLVRLQRRWVRGNEDWRTGTLDMDAVMRLEAVKAAMGGLA